MSSYLKEDKAPLPSPAPSGPGALNLLLPIAQATLLVVGACFAPAFIVVAFSGGRVTARNPQKAYGVLVFLFLLLVSGLAAWRMFRKLRKKYTWREARAVSLVFGVLAPVTLAVGLVLAIFPGGFAASALGDTFGVVGAFAGTVVVTALLSWGLCAFALSMTRRIERLERQNEPAPGPD